MPHCDIIKLFLGNGSRIRTCTHISGRVTLAPNACLTSFNLDQNQVNFIQRATNLCVFHCKSDTCHVNIQNIYIKPVSICVINSIQALSIAEYCKLSCIIYNIQSKADTPNYRVHWVGAPNYPFKVKVRMNERYYMHLSTQFHLSTMSIPFEKIIHSKQRSFVSVKETKLNEGWF